MATQNTLPGAVDEKARDRFTHRLKKFNELKEHAKDPEMMQARAQSRQIICYVSVFILEI